MGNTRNIGNVGESIIHEYLEREAKRNGHKVEAITNYKDEGKFLQDNGCDILETWTDEAGISHSIWNEVKTDTWTVSTTKGGYNAKEIWHFFRDAIEVKTEKGTGNVNIEFMQNVPIHLIDTRHRQNEWIDKNFDPLDESKWGGLHIPRGWYPKYREFERGNTEMKYQLSRPDEHYIWFVFRVNPDNTIETKKAYYQLQGKEKEYTWKTGGGCVAIRTTIQRLVDIVEPNKKKYMGEGRGRITNDPNSSGQYSFGLNVPVKDIWWKEDPDAMQYDEEEILWPLKNAIIPQKEMRYSVVTGDDGTSCYYDMGNILGGGIPKLR